MNDIRFYRGKILCKILLIKKGKALIEYLEKGIVGTKDYPKNVEIGDRDITLTRHCWKRKNERK